MVVTTGRTVVCELNRKEGRPRCEGSEGEDGGRREGFSWWKCVREQRSRRQTPSGLHRTFYVGVLPKLLSDDYHALHHKISRVQSYYVCVGPTELKREW